MDEEKIIKDVVEQTHQPNELTYSDVRNDLGINKPKYNDPIKQREQ